MMTAIVFFLLGVFVGGILVNESVGKDCKRGMVKAGGIFYLTSQVCPDERERDL